MEEHQEIEVPPEEEELVSTLKEICVQDRRNISDLTALIVQSNQQYLTCVVTFTKELYDLRQERDKEREERRKEFQEVIDRYERRLERMEKRCESMRSQISTLVGQLTWSSKQLEKLIQPAHDPSVAIGNIHTDQKRP